MEGGSMVEVILWDNDGLLLDSEAVFFELTQSVFADFGFLLSEEYWGTEYLAKARRTRQIAGELGMKPDLIDRVIELRDRKFLEALHRPVPLRPKVRETLDFLAGRVKQGVVTGSPREKVELMHRVNGLGGYFDILVTQDDVSDPKPHPEPYQIALERFGVTPDAVIAVEDSERGLASAHAAGIPCVVVPNPLTRIQKFEKAYAVEDDVAGIVKHCFADSAATD